MMQTNASLLRQHERTEERAKRVAHGLFNQTGQLLACIHMALAEAGPHSDDSAAQAERIRRFLFDIEDQIVRFSQELYPVVLENLGLRPALAWLGQAVTKISGVAVVVEASIDEALSVPVKTALYRAIEELLNRVIEVAHPRAVRIRLQQETGMISGSICVDGPAKSFLAVSGLLGARARLDTIGGALAIRHESVSGTEIHITIAPRSLAA